MHSFIAMADTAEHKAFRSAQRQNSIHKDRVAYLRLLAKRTLPQTDRTHIVKKGRGAMSKGEMHGQFKGEVDKLGSISHTTPRKLVVPLFLCEAKVPLQTQDDDAGITLEIETSVGTDESVLASPPLTSGDASDEDGVDQGYVELDFAELKVLRDTQRQNSLRKDRRTYLRSLVKRTLPQTDRTHVVKKGRGVMSKGEVKGQLRGEMIDISMDSIGHSNLCKPILPPLMLLADLPCDSPTEYHQTAPDVGSRSDLDDFIPKESSPVLSITCACPAVEDDQDELDFDELKALRSAQRQNSLRKDRRAYLRLLVKRTLPQTDRTHIVKKGRGIMSKGEVKGQVKDEVDIPMACAGNAQPSTLSSSYALSHLDMLCEPLPECHGTTSLADIKEDATNMISETILPAMSITTDVFELEEDHVELNIADRKALRSTQRQKSLAKDRKAYQCVLAKRALPPTDRTHVVLEGRGMMSKGEVNGDDMLTIQSSNLHEATDEVESDMLPAISYKPAVPQLHCHSEMLCESKPDVDEVSPEAETRCNSATASPALLFESSISPALSCSIHDEVHGQEYEEMLPPPAVPLDEDYQLPKSMEPQNGDTQPQSRSEIASSDAMAPPAKIETETSEEVLIQDPRSARREGILREVVLKLRQEAREAEQQAQAEQDRAREIEQKVAAQRKKSDATARNQVLKKEKQRVAKLRKQRNQAQHLQAVKVRADCDLQEAATACAQAQNESTTILAREVAEARRVAKQQADAQLEAALLVGRARAESLRLNSLETARLSERVKAEAEAGAQMLKMQSYHDNVLAAEIREQAEAMFAEAELTARRTMDAAVEGAAALKARAFAQLREKLEAEDKARQEADERLSSESAHIAHVESQRQSDSRAKEQAAALKMAKRMEQQLARNIRKQAEQERRQQQTKFDELKICKAQVLEEQRALMEQAFVEASDLKAKAEVEALEIQARATVAAREEAQVVAQREAAALRERAEVEAETIRARAAEVMWQAEADARSAFARGDGAAARDAHSSVSPCEGLTGSGPARDDSEDEWQLIEKVIEDDEWQVIEDDYIEDDSD
jgi:hypothetical protein